MKERKNVNVSVKMGDMEIKVAGTDGKAVVQAIISTLRALTLATTQKNLQDCGKAE